MATTCPEFGRRWRKRLGGGRAGGNAFVRRSEIQIGSRSGGMVSRSGGRSNLSRWIECGRSPFRAGELAPNIGAALLRSIANRQTTIPTMTEVSGRRNDENCKRSGAQMQTNFIRRHVATVTGQFNDDFHWLPVRHIRWGLAITGVSQQISPLSILLLTALCELAIARPAFTRIRMLCRRVRRKAPWFRRFHQGFRRKGSHLGVSTVTNTFAYIPGRNGVVMVFEVDSARRVRA